MPVEYLKKATLTAKSDSSEGNSIVKKILADIEEGGEKVALEYAAKFDIYEGNVELNLEDIEAATALVPQKLKDDLQFAQDNVRRFAEAQKATITELEYDSQPR